MRHHNLLARLPVRLLLIAGLWLPMVHSHAPVWMQVARDGVTLGMNAADGAADGMLAGQNGNVRHSVESNHDHCPVCALQTAGPIADASAGRIFLAAIDAVPGAYDASTASRPHPHGSGRSPPRLA